MSRLTPALQKYYNAVRHLEQFSAKGNFFDNIGCLDVFFSEFRSITLVLQESLGGNTDPIYQKNLQEFILKDEKVSKWLNDQRVTVIHKHPFKLKKILRIVIYVSNGAAEFKRYEQTRDDDEPIGDYEQTIRETFMNLPVPEVNFSVQYVFVDEDDAQEVNIFDLIEPGVAAMWKFLYAMKSDLGEISEDDDKLLTEIDKLVMTNSHRWVFDCVDYCYYKSIDSFERGSLVSPIFPDVRLPVSVFIDFVKTSNVPISDFYHAFIWLHSIIYLKQPGDLMNTFFVEYDDGTYRSLMFAATLRTTMYRYINRVKELVSKENVVNVYLVTEMVVYQPIASKEMADFSNLNYREKETLRRKTQLAFYKISSDGDVSQVLFDVDSLENDLCSWASEGKIQAKNQDNGPAIMLMPIVNSFKAKMNPQITHN